MHTSRDSSTSSRYVLGLVALPVRVPHDGRELAVEVAAEPEGGLELLEQVLGGGAAQRVGLAFLAADDVVGGRREGGSASRQMRTQS